MRHLVSILALLAALAGPCACQVRFTVLAAAGDESECPSAGAVVPLGDPSRAGSDYNKNSQLPKCSQTASVRGDCFHVCSASDADPAGKAMGLGAVSNATSMVSSLASMPTPRAAGVAIANTTSVCPNDLDVPFGVDPAASTAGADVVIVVTSRPGATSSGLPYGYTCQIDGGVVSVGFVNVDPSRVGTWSAQDRSRYAFQAIVQAIAFNEHLFGVQLNAVVKAQRYLPQLPKPGIAGEPTYEVAYLATPKVKAAAQAHFGCATLPGAELENGYPSAGQNFDREYPLGGLYTRHSFFEKRIFGPEAMTRGARVNDEFVISPMTLAVLEDGGFNVNAGMAQPLRYGERMGCAFAGDSCYNTTCKFLVPQSDTTEPCAEYVEHASDYYCASTTDAPKFSCSYDLKSRSLCQTQIDYPQSLEPWNYLFAKPKLGGPEPLADFCPRAVVQPALSCLTAGATGSTARMEVYGSESACFLSSVIDANVTDPDVKPVYEPMCYRFRCTSRTTLEYQLSGSRTGLWYPCAQDGENPSLNDKYLPQVKGAVRCPRIDTLCGTYDPATAPPVPVITTVEPKRGNYKGGVEITISGRDMPTTADTVVLIAGVEAASCSVKTATQYICTTGEETKDPSELGPGFVRVYSKADPDNGAALKGAYFPFEVADPSPTPVPIEDKDDSGFFQKECIGIKCWIIPLIFLGLLLPCCAYRFLRKKKPKKDAKKLTNDDEDGIQL